MDDKDKVLNFFFKRNSLYDKPNTRLPIGRLFLFNKITEFTADLIKQPPKRCFLYFTLEIIPRHKSLRFTRILRPRPRRKLKTDPIIKSPK